MTSARITQLRLTNFKSYPQATIALEPLTVLIGRNGSGKSNALDALEVLSQLAKGEEIRDALEGNRSDTAGVRGGVEGCAAHGSDSFSVGAEMDLGNGVRAWIEVKVQVRPDLRIVAEEFWLGDEERWTRQILRTVDADPERGDIEASVWNGKPGRNPLRLFRSSHLLTNQLQLRLEGQSKAEAELLVNLRRSLAVLGGVFHLDPVPHLMRGYVPAQDAVLRRTAENLSAAVARLKQADSQQFAELLRVIKQLPENDIRSIELVKGGFGDVMLGLRERKGRQSVKVPARQMSDGMLRMMAIATAVLAGGSGVDLDTDTANDEERPLCLVVEELENGLHPSQAASVLDLVKQSWRDQGFQVVLTTHSPALLDALDGDDHRGVLVCERDRTSGASTVSRLVDLPGYLSLMAGQSLGSAVTTGRLPVAAEPDAGYDQLNRLLGIG